MLTVSTRFGSALSVRKSGHRAYNFVRRKTIVATKPSLPESAPDRINHSRTDPQNHFDGGPSGRPSDIFLPEIYDLMSWFLFA